MKTYFQVMTILFLCLPGLISGQGKGRYDKFWSAGFNVGMIGWSPSTLNESAGSNFIRTSNFGIGILQDNNGNKHPSITANTSIGLHAGFTWKDRNSNNYTSFQLGFQRNKACYSFKLPFSYSFKGDTVAAWVESDSYLTYSASVTRTWHFLAENSQSKSCWYGKIAFGQTFMHRNLGENLVTNSQEDWTENGRGFKLTVVSCSAKSWMLSPEIGRKFILPNGNMLDLGLVYHAPFTDTRSIEYQFYQQGMPAGKNRITYHGSTMMLNLAYTFNYKIKNRPVDSTKMKSAYDDLAVDSADSKHEAASHHHKVNGRHFEVQETMTVTNGEVTILVWDKNRVDGDEISLYLNGKPVLENFTVSKTKKEIILKLEPGSNIIVMHALNLGRVPPNTAALNINDGTKKKNVTLVSDLHKSGALEIIYNP